MNCEEMHNSSEQMAAKMQVTSEEHNVLTENTDLTFSNPNSPPVIKQKKVKKPTRQWAAWTRQEEENFFSALRQVGKNFEKITCRVQSKNKDQVRHYYYRLVRRMKKILGPSFCLDAKNSKDTIAAMLRWWSLLEKYSCTASKLHLKPRRFKIFVEALESQLIKDQKKSRRKRQQGDLFNTCSSSTTANNNINNINNSTNYNNNSISEADPAKIVPSNNKRTNVDGNLNMKMGASKGDLSANRTVKQKRRTGAAYKKWEKAAMAGVSLVADAAEQLERANLDNDHNGTYCNNTKDANAQPLMKLKLQLFPINEATRKALERDSHNPHLELTLSGKKRITSVLEHLNRKWGNCDIACGELLLVPYNAHLDDLASFQKWTIRDHVAVSDVFVSVGSPSVFRLRYGWFSKTDIGSGFSNNHLITQGVQAGNRVVHIFEQSLRHRKGVQCAIEQVGGNHENDVAFNGDNSAKEWADSLTDISVGYLLSEASRAANNNNNLDCVESSLKKKAPQFEEIVHSCDSFDEAIAAHLSTSNNNTSNNNNNNINNNVSIWSAEETCDGFAFNAGAKEASKMSSSSSPRFKGILKELSRNVAANENEPSGKEIKEDCPSEAKDSSSDDNNESPRNDTYITDINWPDSLGPLDLDAPSFRYQIPDVGFSDSFSSLTRIMASSWDAFRNLSFLGASEN